jgi:hypothetical protein
MSSDTIHPSLGTRRHARWREWTIDEVGEDVCYSRAVYPAISFLAIFHYSAGVHFFMVTGCLAAFRLTFYYAVMVNVVTATGIILVRYFIIRYIRVGTCNLECQCCQRQNTVVIPVHQSLGDAHMGLR